MAKNFATMPIIRETLAWTGKLDGDDSGYRNVAVSPLDAENPDALVLVEGRGIETLPIYNVGKRSGLCEYYEGGLGGPKQMLVRAPVLQSLIAVASILLPYGRKLLVVDAWRPWWVQQNLWRYLRKQIITAMGLVDGQLTFAQEVEVGIKADDVGSFCAVVEDDAYEESMSELLGYASSDIEATAIALGKSTLEVSRLYLTFLANLGRQSNLRIQEDAITAHGNGGAVDVWMIDAATGKPVSLGVPFDFVSRPGIEVSPAVINYFDMEGINTAVYADEVSQDTTLQNYLSALGINQVTDAVFHQAQEERRLLFHAMREEGFSYFSLGTDLGEPWHFNGPNIYGGNQRAELFGSGNGCHALLADVRERVSGKPMAVWDNGVAHKLAEQILGPRR